MLIKALRQDMASPNNPGYKWQVGEWHKIKGTLVMCKRGLHLYKSPAQLSIGEFGPRLFEAETAGEMRESDDKIIAKKVRLIREIPIGEVSNWPELDSNWAYTYCRDIKDQPELWKHITNSDNAYHYCKNIKDRPEVWKYITDSKSAYLYCRNIKDRPEIRKRITNSWYAYLYCRYIKDRPEIRKRIVTSRCAYLYCRYIKDRPKIRKHITNSQYAYRYCQDIKDRSEIRKYITDSEDAYYYCSIIKNRPSVSKWITDKSWLKMYQQYVNPRFRTDTVNPKGKNQLLSPGSTGEQLVKAPMVTGG